MITEFEIHKFMNHPRLIKLSFEDDYMITLDEHNTSKAVPIRYIIPHELGFEIRFCYSWFNKIYKDFIIMKNDELYDFILPYFVEHKLSK